MDSYTNNTDKPEKDMREQMEMIFHKQYAQNYNNISSYSVSLIVALVGVFAGFGYCVKEYIYSNGAPNAAQLLNLAYIASLFILVVIAYLSAKYGWSVRRDQFIIYRQRAHYYKLAEDEDADNKPLFPKGYSPFDKNGISILVGTFEYIYRIVIAASIMLVACMILLYTNWLSKCWLCGCKCAVGACAETAANCNCAAVILLIVVTGVYGLSLYFFIQNVKDKYKEMARDFKDWKDAGNYLHARH